jgi:hypothetical protein
MTAKVGPGPRRAWPAYLGATLFVVGALLSGGYAVSLLRTRCEGFSCTYLGVAWLFWAGVLFVPSILLGLFVRRSAALPAPVGTLVRIVFAAHLVVGAGLLCWWLYRTTRG